MQALGDTTTTSDTNAMETLWDLVVRLDGVAELGGVAGALAQAGINVDSVCCAPPGGEAGAVDCHLLVGDGPAAAAALAAAGVACQAREVVVCVLQNRPGTLAAVSAALDAAGAAVDLLYQATERGLVIGASDLGRVRAALRVCGRLSTTPLLRASRT